MFVCRVKEGSSFSYKHTILWCHLLKTVLSYCVVLGSTVSRLYSIGLCAWVFIPVPHCFNYYCFEIYFKIRKCESSSLIFFRYCKVPAHWSVDLSSLSVFSALWRGFRGKTVVETHTSMKTRSALVCAVLDRWLDIRATEELENERPIPMWALMAPGAQGERRKSPAQCHLDEKTVENIGSFPVPRLRKPRWSKSAPNSSHCIALSDFPTLLSLIWFKPNQNIFTSFL